ncbi:MAG: aminotransferase class III-fold pyridoxal phosphate-dependent enzyme [Alphaproteobacteria bacterium]|nr:aminotransferase class III-fold pyridoxal phosphate-dependent enzyme [Alphaproteobacteria bacterium]
MPPGGTQDIYYSRHDIVPLPMIERASGVHMWDVDGNEYIDASSGPMVSAIGHGNNEVIDAMADQARNARNFCAARMPR